MLLYDFKFIPTYSPFSDNKEWYCLQVLQNNFSRFRNSSTNSDQKNEAL